MMNSIIKYALGMFAVLSAMLCQAQDYGISPTFIGDGETFEFSDGIVRGKEFHFTSTVEADSETGKNPRYEGCWTVKVKGLDGEFITSPKSKGNYDKFEYTVQPVRHSMEGCLVETASDNSTNYYSALIIYELIDNIEKVVIATDQKEIKVEVPLFPTKPVIKNFTFHSFEVDWNTFKYKSDFSFDIECENAIEYQTCLLWPITEKPDVLVAGSIPSSLPHPLSWIYILLGGDISNCTVTNTEYGAYVESIKSMDKEVYAIEWDTLMYVVGYDEYGNSSKPSEWIYTNDYIDPDMLEQMKHLDDVCSGIENINPVSTNPLRIYKDRICCSEDVLAISVFDINGNSIMNFAPVSGEMILSNLPSGLYILSYTTKDNITQNIKFIK